RSPSMRKTACSRSTRCAPGSSGPSAPVPMAAGEADRRENTAITVVDLHRQRDQETIARPPPAEADDPVVQVEQSAEQDSPLIASPESAAAAPARRWWNVAIAAAWMLAVVPIILAVQELFGAMNWHWWGPSDFHTGFSVGAAIVLSSG